MTIEDFRNNIEWSEDKVILDKKDAIDLYNLLITYSEIIKYIKKKED